jgi:hypothetical protein
VKVAEFVAARRPLTGRLNTGSGFALGTLVINNNRLPNFKAQRVKALAKKTRGTAAWVVKVLKLNFF